ncbi:MAG TPA: response regulator [Gemmatimonadales bacterium]|nr:response regulator [Gemmatimonadales bacterium]
MRALVVDDSRAMRAMVGRMVRELGFEVSEAGDGREALARLAAAGPFALALVDWNMPGMDGYELVRAIRANPAYRGLRLVMVTSQTGTDHVARALAAGADEYLMKPFTREAMHEKLALIGFDGR